LLSNSVAFPTSPKSSSCEEQRFIPNHLRRQSRKSVRSISSSSKASPVPAGILEHSEPVGSFAVTSPARGSLRHVMSQTTRPWGIPSLWLLKIPSASEIPLGPNDGLPTISRTPSTLSASDTASSSEGPLTPDLVSSPLTYQSKGKGKETPYEDGGLTLPSPQRSLSKLDPILAKVERCSKFRTITECSACQKVGSDYPKCPRCQEMWCSRECRLQGGKRHLCKRT